jgi:hypothetical protein
MEAMALWILEPAPQSLVGEIFEGETIDFTLQLQMCLTEHIGTTGHPFHIHLWRTAHGAVDCKDVEHDTLCMFFPCQHLTSSPIMRDRHPRLAAMAQASFFTYVVSSHISLVWLRMILTILACFASIT